MIRSRIAPLFLALTAWIAVPAMASSSASVTLSGFSVEFLDLNTGDAITPGISWVSGASSLSFGAASVAHGSNPTFDQQVQQHGSAAFGPLAILATSPWAQASAAVSGNSGVNPTLGAQLSAAGNAAGAAPSNPRSPTTFSASVVGPESIQYFPQFALTGNTVAIFKATAVLSAAVQAGNPGEASAQAGASIYVYGNGASDTATFTGGCGRFCGAPQDVTDAVEVGALNPGQAITLTRSLVVIFTNNTGADKLAAFGAEAWVQGNSVAAIVPEPEGYVLFLAGVALIGTVIGRRGRGNRSTGETHAHRPAQG